jgi:hypothetical protein
MKRKTVRLPDELALLLAQEAHDRGVSIAAVVRDALSAHFGLARGLEAGAKMPLPFASLGHSGYCNTTLDVEEILTEEWGRKIYDAR